MSNRSSFPTTPVLSEVLRSIDRAVRPAYIEKDWIIEITSVNETVSMTRLLHLRLDAIRGIRKGSPFRRVDVSVDVGRISLRGVDPIIDEVYGAMRYLYAVAFPAPKPKGYRLLNRGLIRFPRPKPGWRKFSRASMKQKARI